MMSLTDTIGINRTGGAKRLPRLIISSTAYGDNICLVLVESFFVSNNFKSSIAL